LLADSLLLYSHHFALLLLSPHAHFIPFFLFPPESNRAGPRENRFLSPDLGINSALSQLQNQALDLFYHWTLRAFTTRLSSSRFVYNRETEKLRRYVRACVTLARPSFHLHAFLLAFSSAATCFLRPPHLPVFTDVFLTGT